MKIRLFNRMKKQRSNRNSNLNIRPLRILNIALIINITNKNMKFLKNQSINMNKNPIVKIQFLNFTTPKDLLVLIMKKHIIEIIFLNPLFNKFLQKSVLMKKQIQLNHKGRTMITMMQILIILSNDQCFPLKCLKVQQSQNNYFPNTTIVINK